MTKETYIKMTRPFRTPGMAKGIHITNKVCTMVMYVAYPLLLIYMLWQKDKDLLQAVLVPGISFVALTIFRACFNRPRPYETFETSPVIKKDTKGKSFPSRHVFSAMVIAMTFLLVSPWTAVGVIFVVLTVLMAIVRVVSGVHYPSDVIVGAAFAIVVAIIGYIVI